MERGTSGARLGYKIFSFNTSIRNPKRNIDFLKLFEKYDGQLMDEFNLYNYFFQLVQNGFYTFTNIPLSIKEKLENDELLTTSEVDDLILDNPQATGLSGRVMTLLRALKDQGFLMFYPTKNRKNIMKLSKLGRELVNNTTDGSIIYTKAMIGAHAKNPARTSMLNESVPFLNTIFVINEVNKKWEKLGNEPKGILYHEFGAFVLSMKDCDYKRAAEEIINYRERHRYEINMSYLNNYLNSYDVLDFSDKSIVRDYPDEVFRKFEMTGLLVSRGKYKYKYIDFSQINIDKISIILEKYKKYEFKEFRDQEEYYEYLASIEIPWEKDETVRRRIVETKFQILGLKYDPDGVLKEQEEYVDILLRNQALNKAVDKYDMDILIKEMKILSGTEKQKSKFDDLAEPLRLEYLLALLLAKMYGTDGLISNIIYDEEGDPLHYAPAGKSDIVLYREEGSYILEPTMVTSRQQQLNHETTNIVRHVEQEKRKTNLDFRVIMVAPKIHVDVADYFKFHAESNNASIMPSTIEKITHLIVNNKNIASLNNEFDQELVKFKTIELRQYVDLVNSFRI